MKLIFQYMKKHTGVIVLAMIIKLLATVSELFLPSILEYIIDEVVPAGELIPVLLWGTMMFVTAIVCRTLNVMANRRAIDNAHTISYELRQDLFEKTIRLDGIHFDTLTLPSLISRMTSDSYNVQSAVQSMQSLCVRAPMMLVGGVFVAALMDLEMTMIMVVMLPVLIAVVLFVSSRGIPMYTNVQEKLDVIVRIMRENITGIRVVKALSKEEQEIRRFSNANAEMTGSDIRAAAVMAVPGPLMQLCLNIGLSAVVFYGAVRVNQGAVKPGVILAFLTYFNMITMGVMGLNRIFMVLSKASASANRIHKVLQTENEPIPESCREKPETDAFISFEHVSFSYGTGSSDQNDFASGEREKALDDISFTLNKGRSLGIIGPTGCGKTTIINLLMRFYRCDEGDIFIDGRNVLLYQPEELRVKFGTVFQNDMIFMDTLGNNIDFNRNLSKEQIDMALQSAMAAPFVEELDEGLEYQAAIKGANLSGGQKQRIFISRALAARPEILILDDSSSALDYRTDAAMRKAVRTHYPKAALIMIAQRISSIMNLDEIMVLDNGRCIGKGTHEELMCTCQAYQEIYKAQMGALQ